MRSAIILITLFFTSCAIDDIKQDIIKDEIEKNMSIGTAIFYENNEKVIEPIKNIEINKSSIIFYDASNNEYDIDNKIIVTINPKGKPREEKYFVFLVNEEQNSIAGFVAYMIMMNNNILIIYNNTNIIFWSGDYNIGEIK